MSLVLCFGNYTAYGSSKNIINRQQQNIKRYIRLAEIEHQIPKGLLAAIAHVESSSRPFVVNISGKPFLASNSHQAASRVRQSLKIGRRNIDIGVMQLNYRWHGSEFNNVEEMLNPVRNIQYAAKLLKQLHKQHGSWQESIAYYHSSIPSHNIKYKQKVLSYWLKAEKIKHL